MKIVVVMDQFDNENNGTTVSAVRFVETLRARGHEVRIIATGRPEPYKYVVPSAHFGVFDKLISLQGMVFGKFDEKVVRQALEGADIVHLYLPFKLCIKTQRIARKMGIPHIAAFHCQPEHISYNIGLKHLTFLPHIFYIWFKRRFYRYVRDIHCPSAFAAEQLKRHGYKARLHVISNGVDEVFRPHKAEKPPEWRDKFVIAMVGRLSIEKRQDLIIKAVKKSKYRDKIQLVFLGRGPKQKYYERLGKKLKNKPVFKFVNKYELSDLLNQCDLYVHAAEAETEAVACVEAFVSGLVPVIANARMSATKQFAIDERNLFKNKSAKDLCGKIEYWMEHPKEKERMRRLYLGQAGNYSVREAVEKIEMVYRNVIREQRAREKKPGDKNAHIVHMPTPFVYKVDENFRFVNRNIFFRLGSMFLFYIIAIPILSIFSRLYLGLKIKGKKNLKYLKGGAVSVTNHIHYLDSTMVACTLFPRKPHFASLKSNFEIPFIRWLVRILGGVPIPESPKALYSFLESMRRELEKGRIVHFFPEASLWPWYDELRPFKDGAFHLAVKSNVPILPMVLQFRKPYWPVSKIRKNPLITMIIAKPQYPPSEGTDKERIIDIREAVQHTMKSILETKVNKKKIV